MPHYIDTTVLGKPVRVFLFPVTWRSGFRVSPRIEADVQHGIYSIEGRAASMESVLFTLSGDMSLTDAAAEDWKRAVGGLGKELAAFPIYPDILTRAEWGNRIFNAQYVADFTYGGAVEVKTAASVGATISNAYLAPLVFGRFVEAPVSKLATDRMIEGRFQFEEVSPYEFRVEVNPTTAAWPTPDWIKDPEEVIDLDIQRKSLVPRGEIVSHPQATPRWRQEATFLLDGRAQIRAALSFWVDKQGPVKAFNLPTWLTLTTSNVAAPSSIRCRFVNEVLDLDFDTDASAYVTTAFLQEVSAPGITQEHPGRKWMLRARYDTTPNHDELFLTWDKALVGPGGATFQPAQLEINQFVKSKDPQNEVCEFTIEHIEGSLIHDYYRRRLFADVIVTLWSFNPASPGAAFVYWEGRISKVSPNGEKWKVTATLLGGALIRKMPQFRFQRFCNWCVFDKNCGLDENAHKSTGVIYAANIQNSGLELLIALTGWGGPTYAADWFRGGEFRCGTGRQFQSVGVVSSAMEGGNVRLRFSRQLVIDYLTEGMAANVFPGCDNNQTTCSSKYNNLNGGTNRRGFSGAANIPEYMEIQRSTAKAPSK